MPEPRKPETPQSADAETAAKEVVSTQLPEEVGGRGGLDPTRYGDWEKNGRCIDF